MYKFWHFFQKCFFKRHLFGCHSFYFYLYLNLANFLHGPQDIFSPSLCPWGSWQAGISQRCFSLCGIITGEPGPACTFVTDHVKTWHPECFLYNLSDGQHFKPKGVDKSTYISSWLPSHFVFCWPSLTVPRPHNRELLDEVTVLKRVLYF